MFKLGLAMWVSAFFLGLGSLWYWAIWGMSERIGTASWLTVLILFMAGGICCAADA